MKYSIIGNLNGILPNSPEEQSVLGKINTYDPIWRLNPNTYQNKEGIAVMTFEIWLATEPDKNKCFVDMKSFVDIYTGEVSCHICTHDEATPQPCVIVEEYRG